MAGKTNLTATLFSQKKLLGKTSTGTHRADSNEPIPSGLQVATSAVFSEDVPGSPSLTLNEVQAGSVEYVEFILQAVTGSTYDANDFDGDAGSQSSGPHAYRLTLPANYESSSNNSKRGTFPYVNGQILHWTLGNLQVVSPGFSNDVPNPYTLKVYEADDTEIPLLDEIDWQVDYFSGILFVQDYDAGKVPATAKGFIYTGKMLSQSLGEVGSGGGGGSGGGVGWIASGNGSISTSGSVYYGTQNTSNPEIFFSSVGSATFNEQGRNSDFRVEAVNKPNAFKIDADTQQVLILSGGAAASVNEAIGNDVAFYVSGSVGSTDRGKSLFGGDLTVSGTHTVYGPGIQIHTDRPNVTLRRTNNNQESDINFEGAGGVVGAQLRFSGSTSNDLVLSTFTGAALKERIRIGSNLSDVSVDVTGSLRANLGLSGSLTKLHDGSSYLVAGSNVTISSSSNGQVIIGSSAGGGGISFSGGNGSNNQMITADGSGDIVAESNITFNGSQLNVSANILPGSDNTFDLGSSSARFANIYTGDLHLQNDRGHWQIIEEADDLTIVNRNTGKRFKFVLEPYVEEEK